QTQAGLALLVGRYPVLGYELPVHDAPYDQHVRASYALLISILSPIGVGEGERVLVEHRCSVLNTLWGDRYSAPHLNRAGWFLAACRMWIRYPISIRRLLAAATLSRPHPRRSPTVFVTMKCSTAPGGHAGRPAGKRRPDLPAC